LTVEEEEKKEITTQPEETVQYIADSDALKYLHEDVTLSEALGEHAQRWADATHKHIRLAFYDDDDAAIARHLLFIRHTMLGFDLEPGRISVDNLVQNDEALNVGLANITAGIEGRWARNLMSHFEYHITSEEHKKQGLFRRVFRR
jgi:hypothetical protein